MNNENYVLYFYCTLYKKASAGVATIYEIIDILNKNAVHYDELGTINEDQLFINEKTKVSIDELTTSNTNWLTNYMSK